MPRAPLPPSRCLKCGDWRQNSDGSCVSCTHRRLKETIFFGAVLIAVIITLLVIVFK